MSQRNRTAPARRATSGRSWRRRLVAAMLMKALGLRRTGEFPALQREATPAVPVDRLQVKDPKSCQFRDILLRNENSRLRYFASRSGTFSILSKKLGAVDERRYTVTGTSAYPPVPGTTVEKGTHKPVGASSRRHQGPCVEGS